MRKFLLGLAMLSLTAGCTPAGPEGPGGEGTGGVGAGDGTPGGGPGGGSGGGGGGGGTTSPATGSFFGDECEESGGYGGSVCYQVALCPFAPPPTPYPPENGGSGFLAGATAELVDISGEPLTLATATTGPTGIVAFLVTAPFHGYAAARLAGYRDTFSYAGQDLVGLGALGEHLWVVSEDAWDALHAAAGEDPDDPSTGLLTGSVARGDFGANAGFVATLLGPGRVVYRTEHVLDLAATATDDEGTFHVFGVPEGPVTVTASNGAVTLTHSLYVFGGSAHFTIMREP